MQEERGPMGLPADWAQVLAPVIQTAAFEALQLFLVAERATGVIFPPADEVMSAFKLTPYDAVKVFILGQDPYHGPGQAHGLSFSVKPGVPIPPSLRNIYKELVADLSVAPPAHGNLTPWARQGVLMTNAVLTVRQAAANSHKGKGWEAFTDGVIRALSAREQPIVFLLWGGFARKKRRLIDTERHIVIESAHPSPLSAHRGFFGSKPFSKVNAALAALGHAPIDWAIPASQ